jgi:hypothetical protein
MNNSSSRDKLRRAEELIKRLRGVQSCKITADEKGKIAEIHVVASGERLPKMIARDVESFFKANMSMDIDYRKIGVVMIDRLNGDDTGHRDLRGERDMGLEYPDEGDSDRVSYSQKTDAGKLDEFSDSAEGVIDSKVNEATWKSELEAFGKGEHDLYRRGKEAEREVGDKPRLEFLEEDVRIRFISLNLKVKEESIRAEVILRKGDMEVVGRREDVRTSEPPLRIVAEATINAVMELLDEKFKLCLSDIKEVEVTGRRAVVGAVDLIRGRSASPLTGCVFIRREPNEAAVLAVLDALNRPMGRWKSRKEIHYLIK